MIQYPDDESETIYYINMSTGHIQQEHPLDAVYRERVQQEKRLKEQQQKQPYFLPTAGGAGFAAKQEDPLIKAEIDKNVKEQRKLLEQEYVRSIQEIDKNFELKKQEIFRANQAELEGERQKWEEYKRDEERKIRAELEADVDS